MDHSLKASEEGLTHPSARHGEQNTDVASLLRSPSWPLSYERSVGFYARSNSQRRYAEDNFNDLFTTDQQAACEPLLPNNERTQNVYARSLSFNKDLEGRKTNFLQTVLNGVNALAGVGILSMPYAVSQGGWIGLSVLLIFAMVCCYTGVLIKRCIDIDPAITGYPDIGQLAFGTAGHIIISCLLYSELFCVSVEFIILAGDSLTKLISGNGLGFGLLHLSQEQSFMLVSALVMMPTVWLRDLSLISYISAGGVLASIAIFIIITWVGIFDVGFTAQGKLINIQGFPIATGLYAFCYCGHAVFPNIYASMKDRKQFPNVLIVCFILCTLLYGGMAVVGFLMYGDAIESQVTLNLPSGAVATKIAIATMLCNPFAKYALTLTPLAAAVEELIPSHAKVSSRSFFVWGVVIRIVLVAITTCVAIVVPFFAYVMSLVGSFLSTTVGISTPCICYLKLFKGRIPMWEKCLILFLLPFGFAATIAGTYSSAKELIDSIFS